MTYHSLSCPVGYWWNGKSLSFEIKSRFQQLTRVVKPTKMLAHTWLHLRHENYSNIQLLNSPVELYMHSLSEITLEIVVKLKFSLVGRESELMPLKVFWL